ncbi:MAG: response regulator transcription factor [Sphingomonadaceae bacterium]
MKILVVEDDEEMRSLLLRTLTYEGYVVDAVATGEEAIERAAPVPPDLVVLDLMLPGIDGLEVCSRLRAGCGVPILMLTARRALADKVAGFERGADDYLVKPFALEEFAIRVKALLRRSGLNPGSRLRCGDLTMDLASREVWRGDRQIVLTAKEFDLLELLMRHCRQVLRRELIYDRLWRYDFGGESNIIDVYIRYLRSKLNAQGEPELIHTVRGVGYVLKEG